MLAHEIAPTWRARGWDVVLAARASCDVEDAASIERCLDARPLAAIVNCAAYTNVEQAEDEPHRAFAVNEAGAGNLARAAAARGIALLHVSTDYVFDGQRTTPYPETASPAPLGVYGRSKRSGELAVADAGGHVWVVRSGELYGDKGPNFFRSVLGAARAHKPLRVVDDQIVSPTWTRELAVQMAVLAESDAPAGTYHATAAGQTSWFEAATFALRCAGLSNPIQPVATRDYGSKVPRPLYTALEPAALEARGLYCMRAWDVALAEWLGVSDVA